MGITAVCGADIAVEFYECDRVGILGLGGLGHMAIKFAAALGTEVTALSRSASKRDEALACGAHKFIAHGDDAALDAAAASLDFILVTLATTEPVDRLGDKAWLLSRYRGEQLAKRVTVSSRAARSDCLEKHALLAALDLGHAAREDQLRCGVGHFMVRCFWPRRAGRV